MCIQSLRTGQKISDQNFLPNKDYFLLWDNAPLHRPITTHNPPASTSAESVGLKGERHTSSKDISEITLMLSWVELSWLQALAKNKELENLKVSDTKTPFKTLQLANTVAQGELNFTFTLQSSPRPHVGQCLYLHRPLCWLHHQSPIGQGWLHQQLGPGGHPWHSRWLDVRADGGHPTRGWHCLLGKISIRWNLG